MTDDTFETPHKSGIQTHIYDGDDNLSATLASRKTDARVLTS